MYVYTMYIPWNMLLRIDRFAIETRFETTNNTNNGDRIAWILSQTIEFGGIRFNQCSQSCRASFGCIDQSVCLRMQFVK